MTYEEIKKACEAGVATMLELGFEQPEVQFWIKPNMNDTVWVSWRCVNNYKAFHGDPVKALADFDAWLDSRPSKVDRERQEYAKLLAAAIEYGDKIGVEDVLVNPLREAMERLSKNAISLQPAKDDVDEIPF